MNKRALVVAFLAGCFPEVDAPVEAQISCATNDECPEGMKCIVEVGRCTPATSADTTEPSLTDLVLSPQTGGRDAVFTLSFSASEALLLAPVVTGENGTFSTPWTRLVDADGYTFEYAASTGAPEGDMTVRVRLIDQSGNAVTATAGTLTLDTTGPSINVLLVQTDSNSPGMADTVSGSPQATEASVQVDCFADPELTTLVDTTTATANGSFAALDLGDNYTTAQGTSGQAIFWLRAVDSLGNVGSAVPVITDVVAPEVQLVAIERLTNDAPETWGAATSFGATPGTESGRVRILVTGQLAVLPRLEIREIADPALFEATCSLEDLGPSGGTYDCRFTPTGSEPEDTPLSVFAYATSFGAGNVGTLNAGLLTLDFTAPAAPNEAAITVTMNPTGVADSLSLANGTVEPNARFELYTVQNFITVFGPACSHVVLAAGQADANGAAVVSLGDNSIGTALLHQIDVAGNPGCGPCIVGLPCAEATIVANDTVAPSVSLNTSVPRFTSRTQASFSFGAVDDGPSDGSDGFLVHPPVSLYCALDGAPETPCGPVLTLTGLGAGAHRLSYRATDALANSTSAQTFEWLVQPTTAVFSGHSYAFPSDKSYVVDGLGRGHLFLGGEALYHLYESSPDTFELESISDEPVAYAVALFDAVGNKLHVAYQRGAAEPFDVVLATGSTGAWTQSTLHTGRLPRGSIDLAQSGAGTLHVAYSRCGVTPEDACLSSNAFAIDLVSVSTGGPTFETVPDTAFSVDPRLAVDTANDLWLFRREAQGSGAPTLKLAKRASGTWQTSLVVGGSGAPPGAPAVGSGNSHFHPTLAMTAANAPALTYKPTLNGPVWSAIYDTGTWTFSNTTYTTQGVSLSTGSANLWYAFAQAPLYVLRRTATPVWSTHDLALTEYPSSISGALLADGAFGVDAELHVVSAFFQGGTTLRRTVVDGATTTTLPLGERDRYRSFAPLAGALVPSVVVAAGETMTLREYGSGSWTPSATIRSDLDQDGFGLAAAVGTSDTWVAHLDYESSSYGQLMVEKGSGSTWVTQGPLLPSSLNVMPPEIAILPNGNPIVVIARQSPPAELMATWWNGSQFVELTTLLSLASSNELMSYAVLGDHNGATAGGETWVFYGNTAHQKIGVIRFTLSSEDPGVAGCESCAYEDVTYASQPWVSVGSSPAGAPQVLSSDSSYGLRLLTWAGSWSSRDLSSELSTRVFDAESGAWAAPSSDCFPSAGAPSSRFAFTYNASGKLRLSGRFACYLWDDEDVEIMGIEDTLAFPTYPTSAASIGFIDTTHGIWALPSDLAVGAWGNPDAGDVLSFDSASLVP